MNYSSGFMPGLGKKINNCTPRSQCLAWGSVSQRHFKRTSSLDITTTSQFPKSNETFQAVLKKLKREGKAETNHHEPINAEDLSLIQDSLDINTPVGLQRKFFIDIMLFFANRGMENLREMRPEDFVLFKKVDVVILRKKTQQLKITGVTVNPVNAVWCTKKSEVHSVQFRL